MTYHVKVNFPNLGTRVPGTSLAEANAFVEHWANTLNRVHGFQFQVSPHKPNMLMADSHQGKFIIAAWTELDTPP